jgi:hypothetical protein
MRISTSTVPAFTLGLAALVAGCSSDPITSSSALTKHTWRIESRVENGGAPALPECAKDDTLTFSSNQTFDSIIGGTACNPAETDVTAGTYALSATNVITFTTPAFAYEGKLLKFSDKQLVIEFTLGEGFVITDTFVPADK